MTIRKNNIIIKTLTWLNILVTSTSAGFGMTTALIISGFNPIFSLYYGMMLSASCGIYIFSLEKEVK